jgi:hypothetical protein
MEKIFTSGEVPGVVVLSVSFIDPGTGRVLSKELQFEVFAAAPIPP